MMYWYRLAKSETCHYALRDVQSWNSMTQQNFIFISAYQACGSMFIFLSPVTCSPCTHTVHLICQLCSTSSISMSLPSHELGICASGLTSYSFIRLSTGALKFAVHCQTGQTLQEAIGVLNACLIQHMQLCLQLASACTSGDGRCSPY